MIILPETRWTYGVELTRLGDSWYLLAAVTDLWWDAGQWFRNVWEVQWAYGGQRVWIDRRATHRRMVGWDAYQATIKPFIGVDLARDDKDATIFTWLERVGPPTIEIVAYADYAFCTQIEHHVVLDSQRLSLAETKLAHERIRNLMDKEVERTLLADYPPAYDTRTGMPGALTLPEKPSRYGVIADLEGIT